MEEIWKDIEEFKGVYVVSNLGRIKSLDRKINRGRCVVSWKGKMISSRVAKNGYSVVKLNVDGKHITRLVHRLIAQAFIPNPNNLPEVNHKDENIQNNSIDNLEWCTSKYNANYGTRNERCRNGNKRFFKSIYQIDIDSGMIVRWWECINDASKLLKIDASQISRVCKGTNVSAGGFKWVFTDDYDKSQKEAI